MMLLNRMKSRLTIRCVLMSWKSHTIYPSYLPMRPPISQLKIYDKLSIYWLNKKWQTKFFSGLYYRFKVHKHKIDHICTTHVNEKSLSSAAKRRVIRHIGNTFETMFSLWWARRIFNFWIMLQYSSRHFDSRKQWCVENKNRYTILENIFLFN